MATKAFDIHEFAEEIGSAVSIWGDDYLAKKIQKLRARGAKFMSVCDTTALKTGRAVGRAETKGWKILAEESNYDITEVLMYR